MAASQACIITCTTWSNLQVARSHLCLYHVQIKHTSVQGGGNSNHCLTTLFGLTHVQPTQSSTFISKGGWVSRWDRTNRHTPTQCRVVNEALRCLNYYHSLHVPLNQTLSFEWMWLYWCWVWVAAITWSTAMSVLYSVPTASPHVVKQADCPALIRQHVRVGHKCCH